MGTTVIGLLLFFRILVPIALLLFVGSWFQQKQAN